MKCTVYRLWDKGEKLSQEDIRANGVAGDLMVTDKGPLGQPGQGAYLRDSSGQVILQLMCVKVKKIERDGVLVSGRESTVTMSQAAPTWHQAWWCVVG